MTLSKRSTFILAFALLALMVLLMTLYFWVCGSYYNKGHAAGVAKTEAHWQAHYNELLLKNLSLTQEVAHSQRALDVQATELERQSDEEKQVLIADYEQRISRVRAGTERVYIPAKITAGGYQNANAATAGATPPLSSARCELDPEVVASLTSITRDGDAAIIDYNNLLARYNAARQQLTELEAKQ